MPRLFVAIDLPEDVRHAVAGLCTGVSGARWVRPEQIHLTLRFIGEVDVPRFFSIRQSLASIAFREFTFRLNGVGSFPGRGLPRVLWTGVDRCEALVELRNRIEDAVVSVGCPAEERPFSPHITLARLKETPRSFIAAFLDVHAKFGSVPFTVTEFRLYSSILAREGSRHSVEAAYPLQGSGPAAR